MYGAILPFTVDSVVITNCITKKVNKQVEGILNWTRDQRTKEQGG